MVASAPKSVRVLHVTDTLGPGGAERVLLWHLSRMNRDRYENHLAWLFEPDTLAEDFSRHASSLVPLRVKGRGDFGRAAVSLARWIRAHRPDVIHGQLLRAMILARVAAKLAGHDRLLMAWHNTSYDDSALRDDFGGSKVKRNVVKWCERGASLIDGHYIAVSHHVAKHYSEHLWVRPDRITVIHNPLDPIRCAPIRPEDLAKLREELGLGPKTHVLISVARLVEQKAHFDMVRAFSEVRRRFSDTVMLFAGMGPLESALKEEVSALGHVDNVRFLGFRLDVPALLQLSDLFLFPSVYEGFGVALAEALANGLPAVVTDLPVHHEVARDLDTVRYVPVHAPGALAAAIIDILEAGSSLRERASQARGSVLARFSPEVQARRFEQTIDRVAASR